MNLVEISSVYFTLISIFVIQSHGERNFEILMNSYNCSSNPKFALVSVCYLNKTVNPNRARAFFDMQIQRDIQTVKYSWVVFLIRKETKKRHKLLSVKNMNGCEFLAGISVIPFLKMLRNIMLDYGTMPLKCPLKNGSRFLFNDLIVDNEKFPQYVPETHFVATVNLTTGKNFIFAITTDGKVIQKSNIVYDDKK